MEKKDCVMADLRGDFQRVFECGPIYTGVNVFVNGLNPVFYDKKNWTSSSKSSCESV